MITIGIRAAPRAVTFAVYDSLSKAVKNVEEIKVPIALSVPARLKYVRSNVLDVLREYNVDKAGVRVTESNSQTLKIDRIQIEGVIQEAFASSSLQDYYVGQISTISARLGLDRIQFKPMVEGRNDLEIENWDAMTKEGREAILCAIGAASD